MYAIVGATGNTGRVVTEHLLAKGRQVRAIGRSSERLHPLEALGATSFLGSLEDAADLARAFCGVTAGRARLLQARRRGICASPAP